MSKFFIRIASVGIVLIFAAFLVTYVMIRKSTDTSSIILDNGLNHTMKLTSTAFNNDGNIPSVYTCTGKNVNPPLIIDQVPKGAKSLVLILDDPDAPGGTWVHWVVYNISPSVVQVIENSVPTDGVEAITSFGKAEYGGPCPPSGIHHYHFKLYALDEKLLFDKQEQVNKQIVVEKMQGHILDQAELIGLYSK